MSGTRIWGYDRQGGAPGAGPPGSSSDPGDTVGWLWQEPEQLSGGLLVLRCILGNPLDAGPWTGCGVHLSLDDVTYRRWWEERHRSTIGESENQLAATAQGWQAGDTVDVDLSDSPGELDSTNQAGAEAGINLALIGDEVISFATVAVLGANRYRLTGIVRGWFGTTVALHAIGSRFAMIDFEQHREPLPDEMEGDAWFYKPASINVAGTEQDLAGIGASSITPAAVGGVGDYWRGDKTWQTLAHAVLSATHSDALAAAVVKGDVMIGDATPKWSRLGVGADGEVLAAQADGTVAWEAIVGGGDVTAAAVLADHTLIRGDGGAKGIQDSGVTLDDSDILAGLVRLGMTTADSHDKLRVWNASSYAIGMKSVQTFGDLNDYAVTFTMSNTDQRGWLWRRAEHSDAEGSMSLSTRGVLTTLSDVNPGGHINMPADKNIHLDGGVTRGIFPSTYLRMQYDAANAISLRSNVCYIYCGGAWKWWWDLVGLHPYVNDAYDLGKASYYWRDLRLSGQLYGSRTSFVLARLGPVAGLYMYMKAGEMTMSPLKGILTPRAGSIVGVSLLYDVTVSGRTLSVDVLKNGVVVWGNAIDNGVGTEKEAYFVQARGTDVFVAGDTLAVRVGQGGGGGFSTVDDMIGTLELVYDT